MNKQEYEARISEITKPRTCGQTAYEELQAAKDMVKANESYIASLEAENVKLEAMLEKGTLVLHEYPAEKPPESGIKYLVLIDGEIPRLAVYGHHVLYEDDTMNKWYSDEGPAKGPTPYGETEITHWAYLPAPPREGE